MTEPEDEAGDWWSRTRELRRWAVVSILMFSFTFGSTIFFREVVGLVPELSFFITLTLAILGGFMLCRCYVYQAQEGSIGAQFLKYVSSVAAFRLLDFILFVLLVRVAQLWYPLVMVIVLPVTSVIKFFAIKSLVFVPGDQPKETKDTDGR